MESPNHVEITIMCQHCLHDVTASLEKDYFICEVCGQHNDLDNEEWKAKHNLILKKVFGTKPAKPENN